MEHLSNLLSERTLTVNVGINDLRMLIDEAIKKAKEEFTPKKEETYLTIEKVAEILEVDRSTLWRWNKTGYLTHIEIGGKRRYKKSDIDRILEK